MRVLLVVLALLALGVAAFVTFGRDRARPIARDAGPGRAVRRATPVPRTPAARDVRRLARDRPEFGRMLDAVVAGGEPPPGFTATVLANVEPAPDNPFSIRLVAAALASADPEERETAKRKLLEPELFTRLAAFSGELIPGLADWAVSDESAELLGLLDVPEASRTAMLAAASVPDRVKARLGDMVAEGRVIERFRSATPFEKRARGFDLLYLGTRRAMEAFAEGLASTEAYSDPRGNTISVAQALIQDYGRVHPEARLFQPRTYARHLNTSVEEFRQPRHQRYLRRVERYLAARHGVSTRIVAPFLVRGEWRTEKYRVDAPPEG